jgi:ferric-dicitrate binding protein FerR (iron transport regulator)
MDYTRYSVTDFADDPGFRSWVNGTDPAAVAFWEDWVARHPGRRDDVEGAVRLVRLLDAHQAPSLPAAQVQAEVDKFRRAIAGGGEAAVPGTRTTPRRAVHPWWAMTPTWRVAAVLAGLLVLAGPAYWALRPWLHPTHTISTPLGGLQRVTLPDGSTVALNANSRLRYARDWSPDAPREVWLEGEAYFQVTKKRNPRGRVKFTVHAGNVRVEVLGTAFDVHSRRGATRVVLTEGKVQLTGPTTRAGRPFVMQSGDLAALSAGDTAFVRKRVNPESYAAWRRNQLVFVSTPLAEVAQLLEDHYGLKVVFADDALAREKFTATIRGRNPNVLLKVLAESFGLVVTRRGNHVTISRP